MANFDLRECLNAISDVVNNRPRPIREFDQIFMKTADMLLQTELVSRHFNEKDVVFIGDGDAIGLCLVHLHSLGLLPSGPRSVRILDFDQRVILSVQHFARCYEIEDRIDAVLYNVADPLPDDCWQRYDGFYTNPPFGASNEGRSIEAFLQRGVEAMRPHGLLTAVVADDPRYDWTQQVLFNVQEYLIRRGFLIEELVPRFHKYHLDDAPALTSCSLIARERDYRRAQPGSAPLPAEMLENFYGEQSPLKVHYVRDLTNAGKLASRDYQLEPIVKD